MARHTYPSKRSIHSAMPERLSRLKHTLWVSIFLLCLSWQIPALADEPAPAFSLPTDDGAIALSQLQGQVVYVDFWASWCGPCRKSFPWMNDLHSRYEKQGLRIVAINLDTDRSLSARFLEKYPARFIIAYDPQGDVAEAYHVSGMPSSYLIDRQGRIHATHLGFRESDREGLEMEIRALLKQN